MLGSLTPLLASLVEKRLPTNRPAVGIRRTAASDGLDGGAHWRCNSDRVGVISGTALDAIPGREERVEALNQVRVASEEF